MYVSMVAVMVWTSSAVSLMVFSPCVEGMLDTMRLRARPGDDLSGNAYHAARDTSDACAVHPPAARPRRGRPRSARGDVWNAAVDATRARVGDRRSRRRPGRERRAGRRHGDDRAAEQRRLVRGV